MNDNDNFMIQSHPALKQESTVSTSLSPCRISPPTATCDPLGTYIDIFSEACVSVHNTMHRLMESKSLMSLICVFENFPTPTRYQTRGVHVTWYILVPSYSLSKCSIIWNHGRILGICSQGTRMELISL